MWLVCACVCWLRYAEPGDGTDALCSKLSELTDNVTASTSLQVSVDSLPYQIVGSREMASGDDTSTHKRLQIAMNEGKGEADMFVHMPLPTSTDQPPSLPNWVGNLATSSSMDTVAHQDANRLPADAANATPVTTTTTTTPTLCISVGGLATNDDRMAFAVPIEEPADKTLQTGSNAHISPSITKAALADWESHMVGDIVAEVMALVTKQGVDYEASKTSTEFKLHCTLLLQRANCLEMHVKRHCRPSVSERLEFCSAQILAMLAGHQASAARLLDHTTSTPSSMALCPTMDSNLQEKQSSRSSSCNSASSVARSQKSSSGHQSQRSTRRGNGCTDRALAASTVPPHGPIFSGQKYPRLHAAVIGYSTRMILETAMTKTVDPTKVMNGLNSHLHAVDAVQNTALHYAAAIGRCAAVSVLLPLYKDTAKGLNSALLCKNKDGHIPVELAALRGHWKMVEILTAVGVKYDLHINGDELMQEVLARDFYQCAGRLVASGLCTLSDSALRGRVPSSTLAWVIQKRTEQALERTATAAQDGGAVPMESAASRLVYLNQAVKNGMSELVQKLVDQDVVPASSTDLVELLMMCGGAAHSEGRAAAVHIATTLLGAFCATTQPATRDTTNATPAVVSGLGELVYTTADNGWTHLLGVLLKHLPPACLNWKHAETGATPLWIACAKRNTDCIMLLLECGACDVDVTNNKGTAPLISSCRANHCAAVGALLARGARIATERGIETATKTSAVWFCCHKDRPEILRMLLTRLARTDGEAALQAEFESKARLDGFNAIMSAAKHDHDKVVKVLLQHGAGIEDKTDATNNILAGAAPLHIATYYGAINAALALIEGGACVDSTDLEGRTPLHLAVQQNRPLLVRLLRNHGADIAALDDSGMTPSAYCLASASEIRQELVDPALDAMMAAARSVNSAEVSRCVQLVQQYTGLGPGHLSSKSCVEIHAGDKWTPLLEAVVCGNLMFACALVDVGADPYLGDARGLDAVFWSQALHGPDASDKLKQAAERSAAAGISMLPTLPQTGAKKLPTTAVHTVACKDGNIDVSRDAFEWMQTNFPPIAASAVPMAVVKLAVQAQNFHVDAVPPVGGEDVDAAPLEGTATQLALQRLQQAAARDVRGAMLLEMSFRDIIRKGTISSTAIDAASTRADDDKTTLIARMADGWDTVVAYDEHGTNKHPFTTQLPSPAPELSTECSVAEFFRTVLAKQPHTHLSGPDALCRLFEGARRAAIGAVAAGTVMGAPHATLQQCFALSLLSSGSFVFSGVNHSLKIGGEELMRWAPFIWLLQGALDTLPMPNATRTPVAPHSGAAVELDVPMVTNAGVCEVYRCVPCTFDKQLYAVGNTVSWAGFASATTRWATVLPGHEDSKNSNITRKQRTRPGAGTKGSGLVFCIQSRTARSIASFSSCAANDEVLLLPGVQYRVKGWFQCDPVAFEQANCRYTSFSVTQAVLDGSRAVAGKSYKSATIVVELEEL